MTNHPRFLSPLLFRVLLVLFSGAAGVRAQPILDSTLLPLVQIETGGPTIPDEPKITAQMGIAWKGGSLYNKVGDPFGAYDGFIGIETRGESSQDLYPKPSYTLETRNPDGSNRNVSLLGLPPENDWVLYGPYGDKSLIRNALSYRMYEIMGHYSPRTRFVELLLNGEYMGLYLLVEKIKRDRNRVDIRSLGPEDNVAPGITGGYILRVDKLTDVPSEAYWTSTADVPVSGHSSTVFQYFDPGYDELTGAQRTYIRNYLNNFEQRFAGSSFADPATGYRAYLDIPSFVDILILNEVIKDVDAFRLSHYFYKEYDGNGGKLVNGPPWDYNLTFGNSDFSEDIHETYNWIYDLGITIFWWDRAMQDPWFRNEVACRWEELYDDLLSKDGVEHLIDSILLPLDGAVERNFLRWPILGTYVWPNHYVGQTHLQEIDWLKSWVRQRLGWIQGQWGGECTETGDGPVAVIPRTDGLTVVPNPSSLTHSRMHFPVAVAPPLQLRITDVRGQVVHVAQTTDLEGDRTLALPPLGYLPDGIYILDASDATGETWRCRLVKEGDR